MAQHAVNERFPRLHARISAEQMQKLESMALEMDATPARVVRLLIDKAHLVGAPQIFFEGTNDKSAHTFDGGGALVTTN